MCVCVCVGVCVCVCLSVCVCTRLCMCVYSNTHTRPIPLRYFPLLHTILLSFFSFSFFLFTFRKSASRILIVELQSDDYEKNRKITTKQIFNLCIPFLFVPRRDIPAKRNPQCPMLRKNRTRTKTQAHTQTHTQAQTQTQTQSPVAPHNLGRGRRKTCLPNLQYLFFVTGLRKC